jgi:type IV pilus assembly protein PilC
MLTYRYEARNATTGQHVKAQVQADTEQAAAKLIRSQGLTPLSIEPEKAGGGHMRRIKVKDKVLFSRQLSTLINAGLPLVQSLRSVGEQTTNKPLRLVISRVISDVEAGQAFSRRFLTGSRSVLSRPVRRLARSTKPSSGWPISKKRMLTSSLRCAAP